MRCFQDDPMVKQKLQAEAKETVNTRSEKSESRADSARDTPNRPSINQVTKHVEIPRGRRPTQFVDRVVDAPGP